jgi:hypothetical protein
MGHGRVFLLVVVLGTRGAGIMRLEARDRRAQGDTHRARCPSRVTAQSAQVRIRFARLAYLLGRRRACAKAQPELNDQADRFEDVIAEIQTEMCGVRNELARLRTLKSCCRQR